jgi:hypothetical protein
VDGPLLRPLQVGEILDAAIKIYRARFGTLVKIVFVVTAPVEVLSALVSLSLSPGTVSTTNPLTGETNIDVSNLVGATSAAVLVAILSIIASQLATAASLKAVSATYLGEEDDWQGSLRFALSKLGPLLWLTFLLIVLGAAGIAICVLLVVVLGGLGGLLIFGLFLFGVYLYVSWSVAVPALLLEDYRGIAAFRRSRQLVKGRWWPVFGAVVVTLILSAVVGFIVQGLALGAVISSDNTAVEAIVSAIGSIVSSTLVTPFAAAVYALLYFDLRVRKEGFDLEVLARSLGSPGGPDDPGPPPPPFPPI